MDLLRFVFGFSGVVGITIISIKLGYLKYLCGNKNSNNRGIINIGDRKYETKNKKF